MGGGIAVTSEVGHGSVFSICVPANTCGSTESADLAQASARGARARLGSLRPCNADFVAVSVTETDARGCLAIRASMARRRHLRSARNPRLLVVDDIADNRTILARRFQKRNFEIVEADGGMTALELIATSSFDAMLLDVMMPDISGLEVLRRIRLELFAGIASGHHGHGQQPKRRHRRSAGTGRQ